MVELNLLPSKKKQKVVSLAQLGYYLRGINLVLILIFFAVSLLFVFLITFNQSNIDSLRKRESDLRNDLKRFTDTEVKYNFIKDRAEKGKLILSSRDTLKRANDLKLFLDRLSTWKLDKAEVDKSSMSFSLTISSYQDLIEILSAIRESEGYRNIVINSLGFEPSSGYKLDVDLKI